MKPVSGAWMLRSVDRRAVARDLEAVHGARRGCDERSRAAGAVEELDLAVEDEERVDVIVVRVRVDAFEARLERQLDRRQVRQLGLDEVRAVATREPFARSGRGDDRRVLRLPAVLGRVEAVEPGVHAAQVVGEAAARRVEVEEAGPLRAVVVEAVDDVGRHGDERAGGRRDRAPGLGRSGRSAHPRARRRRPCAHGGRAARRRAPRPRDASTSHRAARARRGCEWCACGWSTTVSPSPAAGSRSTGWATSSSIAIQRIRSSTGRRSPRSS